MHTTLGQLGEILKQLSEHFETTLGPHDDFFSRDGRFTQRGPALYEKKSGKRVSRGGREKRDSEEVCHLNFVGGGRPQHEESEVPLFPALNAIWAGSPKIIVGRKSVFMT